MSSGSNIYLNGHSLSWPNDILFTNNDCTVTYPYWVQPDTITSSHARIFVKIQSIPASPGNLPIKVWYSKSGESSHSDGSLTFVLFDDFDGTGAPNSALYTWATENPPSKSGSILTIPSAIRTIVTYDTTQYKIAGRIKGNPSSDYNGPLVLSDGVNIEAGTRIAAFFRWQGDYAFTLPTDNAGSPGVRTPISPSIAQTSEHFYYVELWKTTSENIRVTDYNGIVGTASTSSTMPNNLCYIRAMPSPGGPIYWDYITIRKFATVEPGYGSYGAETQVVTQLTAGFYGQPQSGLVPLSVSFTDTSEGTPSGWQWSFGDGTPNATIKNPVHVYTSPGVYTVTLTVTAGGLTSSFQRSMYISVVTPIPTSEPPEQSAPANQQLAIDQITDLWYMLSVGFCSLCVVMSMMNIIEGGKRKRGRRHK